MNKKIHFIGIGGIGVSALARYYLEKGFSVSGSDLVDSEITKAIKEKGAVVFIGKHKAESLPKGTDLVVFSPAVRFDNPELMEAKKLKIKTQSYPEALGELTKNHFTIAISGAHGKSTTTAMIGLLLIKAGLDPTVIVGTKVGEFGDSALSNAEGSNCRVGKSKYLIIEACEHEESFLNYWPKIAVITNIEREHLDYYKNLNNILKAFKKFILHLPKDGFLVANKEDKNIKKLQIANCKFQIKGYSLRQKEAKKIKKILQIPGNHNIYNALAALSVARILNIPDKVSFNSISQYQGAWRRFDIKKGKVFGSKEIILLNDYAHHPTEIKALFSAIQEKFKNKKIWVIFQPHQYQRTFYLFKDFVKVLSGFKGERLILTDIYDVAGREEESIKKSVSSEKLVKEIKSKKKKEGFVIYLPGFKEILKFLEKNLKGGEVLVIMGAGDIYNLNNFIHLTESI
ncbi:MAG: UDP-N-acetylmuramate--L-alanine ligase [Candidatus Nealsonbacteria bacterium]|nr:UDP-N-acetylmuramate--L-alanine ligase [Candidatus Nealsonbacteria bacterium]